ncbi:MAG: aminotransferase class V-fold PLP-dependent enzyme [Eubacteriales bacterium]|nr:aminotransferase class V-fold PLP-dependent enzyme [Eubacteriales bacterium]
MTYLDNAATSLPKAPGTAAAMAWYTDALGVNIARGVYAPANEASARILGIRENLSALFGFKGPVSHVVFTPGATFGLNTILRGYLRPGDHVLVGSLEHNAVMRPLTELSETGVSFTRIPADREGITDADSIPALLRPNTRLVLVGHASNVTGTLFPLEKTAAICREYGLPLAVDAAQTAGHFPIDFFALGLAALCVPGHKGLLGPQGIGALLLSRDFTRGLRPIVTGGTGSASDREQQPDYMPDRFESGTLNLPGIFGLGAALDYVLKTGVDTFRQREIALTARLLDGLSGLPLRIPGPQDPSRRVGVVSIDFTGRDNALMADRLEREFGILTRVGLHCAPNAHRVIGTFPQGTVRLSLGHQTTEQDIDLAIEAIRAILN